MDNCYILVDDKVIDITDYSSLGLALSYYIQDVTDIDSAKNYTSKTIRVPGTATNCKIFQFYDLFNGSASGYVAQWNNSQHLSRVVVGSNEIINGVVKMTQIEIIRDVPYFSFVIIGNSRQWLDNIKDSLISELDFSEMQHEKTYQLANQTWHGSYPYLYPIIDTGIQGLVTMLVVS